MRLQYTRRRKPPANSMNCRATCLRRLWTASAASMSASQIAGFAGAILALLLSTYSTWHDQIAHSPGLIGLVLIAVGCLGRTGWYGFKAIRPAEFQWISDRPILFTSELLDYPDELQRYHILGNYRSILSHQEVSDRKARFILVSQNWFIAGAAILGLCLLMIHARPWSEGLSVWLDNGLLRWNLSGGRLGFSRC